MLLKPETITRKPPKVIYFLFRVIGGIENKLGGSGSNQG
jgi:hypothetical protein